MILKKFSDIKDKVIDYWATDAERGLYCGFPFFNEYYSLKMGSCTDITGHPTSGKSHFLLEVLINVAELHNIKSYLYAPDMGTDEEIFSDIISKVAKKQFNKTYIKNGIKFDNKNYITEKQIYDAGSWVNEYFELLDYDKKPTPTDIYNDIEKLSKEKPCIGVIDSWKDLKHNEQNKRVDLYLDEVLTHRNRMVQKTGSHIFQVIHPEKGRRDEKGNMPVPDAYSLKGGSSWYDNGKSILVVHRPSPFESKAEIYVQKAKPRTVGIKGYTDRFEYEPKTGRFFENDGVQKIYAGKEHNEPKELPF